MPNVELHLHTDAYYKGIGDGAQTVVEAIDTASKRGATAVAITDHGNCANWIDFFNYANGKEVDHQELGKKGLNTVKPILGVEAYIAYPEHLIEDKELKEHLVLLAKDYEGYQQISRFVAETNRNIDSKGRPVGTFDMLDEFFHDGHVVCSSACIAGVLATPLLYNERINKEIGKIERRIERSEESLGVEYTIAKRAVDEANEKIDARQARIDELSDIANKKYGKTLNAIKKEKDESVRQMLQDAVNVEIAETDLAKEEIKNLKEEIKDIKASVKDDKAVLTKSKNKLETIEKNTALINELKGLIVDEETLINNATTEAARYQNLFGDDFYAELQYHGIPEEAYVMPKIADIAKNLGIKCIITNDVHMATKDDLQTRNLIRNSAEIKKPWSPAITGDDELYFKTSDEKADMLSQILPREVVLEAIANVEAIADECNLDHLTEGHHYPSYDDATAHLRELARTGHTVVTLADGREIEISSDSAGIEARYGDAWNEELEKRFEYEMDVIDKMGFSSYFLFIADVLNKCKTARDNATDIGPGRGSGAGSIVCFMSGITELDPIKYGLLFERFLNPSRVSMPKQYWAFNVNPIAQGCVA